VVDEAHTIPSMVLMMCGSSLPKSIYKFPADCKNELTLIDWLQEQIRRYEAMASFYMSNKAKFKEIIKELEGLRFTLTGLEENPQNYAIWTSPGKYKGRQDMFLNIKPLRPPRAVTQQLLASNKLIIMSGTLFKSDIEDLIGDQPYAFLDLPSEIPVESRLLRFLPTPFPLNFETDPAKIASQIKTIIDKHPGENTIIHVPYSLSTKLRDHLPFPFIFNTTADDKADAL
jgi:Rad3-related DNA helicase